MAEERSTRLRLFVAAAVPGALLDSLVDAAQELKPLLPGARWSDVANQHVTLKFLGWADPDALSSVEAACASVAAGAGPGRLALGELGAFPSKKRVRVVWVGLVDSEGLLARVAAGLDRALAPLGFEAEQRAFTAHLTLARLKTPLRMAGEWPSISIPTTPWTCDEVTLFRSHLSPKGARYEALASYPLGG